MDTASQQVRRLMLDSQCGHSLPAGSEVNVDDGLSDISYILTPVLSCRMFDYLLLLSVSVS